MSRSPRLSEVLRRAIDARAATLHVALPGRVTIYDPALNRVFVQLLIKAPFTDEAGETVHEDYPVLPDVPLVFPGMGEWGVTFPVAVGDTVLVVFCDRSIDKWLALGGNKPVEPMTAENHGLSDAVAIPGLRSFHDPLAAATDGMVLGRVGGLVDGVALASKVLARLDDLWEAFRTHLHTDPASGVTGPAGEGPLGVPNPLWPTTPGTGVPVVTVASQTVKVSE